MARFMTTYTEPTQDALSESSAMTMGVVAPMTMAVSTVTTLTTVVGLAAVATSRRMARNQIWGSVGLGTEIAIGLARAIHDRLMLMHG